MRIDLATISRWRAIIAGTDDLDAIEADAGYLDTLDGETDALDAADRVIAGIQNDEAMVKAIKAQEAQLAERKRRIEARGSAGRRVLTELLTAIGVRKLERPRATVSYRAGVMKAVPVDPDLIPSQLMTVKTTTSPDLRAIKAQLEAGVHVPGAELVRGDDGISMRVA